MRYLVLLLIAVSAVAAEPKFHFQDCVVVLSGFYKGCTGRVQAITHVGNSDLYDVNLTCRGGEGTFQTLKESDIKLSGCKDAN